MSAEPAWRSRPMTAEELADLPDDGWRHELVEGELTSMPPTGLDHGEVALRIGARVLDHVDEHRLGKAYAAETGFMLSRGPDSVKAPDVAFVAANRLPAGSVPGFGELVPDLVVEVVSPSDRASQVAKKASGWLDAGARLVWIVDPAARLATVHRPSGSATVVREDGVLDGEDVLPGLRLALARLFPR